MSRIELNEKTSTELLKNLVIPPRPFVLQKMMALKARKDINLADVSDVISEDLTLSAAVLKAANSPLYGASRTLTSLHQAVSLIGLKNVLQLVDGLALRVNLSADAPPSIEDFWERVMHEARIANLLCNTLAQVPDDCQSFALFRGCGIALMLMRIPNYERTLRMIRQVKDPQITRVESELHGTSHDVVGYLVARAWNMPEIFCKSILMQHYPDLFLPDNDDLDHGAKTMIAVSRAAQFVWRTMSDRNADPGWKDREEALLPYLGMGTSEFEDWVDKVHDKLIEE